ncbi:hypothetical protein [Rhodoflexus sp.]
MTTFIDNINQVRRFYFLAALLVAIPLLLIFFRESLGISMFDLRLLVFVVVTLVIGSFLMMKPTYIRYENNGKVMRLHFYNLLQLPFVRRGGKVIEIRKDEFRNYELSSYNYGMSKTLVLVIQERAALLPYPPVSVSLLNKQQLTELLHSLERWKE